MTRVVSFDIEATGLKADFAYLLSSAFLSLDDAKPKILALGDYDKTNLFKNEKALVKDTIEHMDEADILVTYFGTGYDLPFMKAKALEYGLPFPAPRPHIDLFYTVKSNLALSRKSLATVSYFAGNAAEKSLVEGRIWKAAMAGDAKAMKWIKDHNGADVMVLRETYLKLRPLVRMHPKVAGTELGKCRFCGSERLQRRGIAVTALVKNKVRIQCQNCAAWDLRAA